MMGRWIGFAADKPAGAGAPSGHPFDAAAVPLLEEGVRQLERLLLDEQAALSAGPGPGPASASTALPQWSEKASPARGAGYGSRRRRPRRARSRPHGVRDSRRSRARASAPSVRTSARADAQVIQSLRERLETLEDSTSFRLGHALVLGAKGPAGSPACRRPPGACGAEPGWRTGGASAASPQAPCGEAKRRRPRC